MAEGLFAPDGALLKINLGAIAANYRMLSGRLGSKTCACVVKANAYGLGVESVAPALASAGCKHLFVATLEEGIQLRSLVPEASIYVFHGLGPGEVDEFLRQRLIPVLNDESQLARWEKALPGNGMTEAALQVDTGMSRVGFDMQGFLKLAADKKRLDRARIALLMSHLACADMPAHPLNEGQLRAFRTAHEAAPQLKASLANSSGIFLGPDYHFTMARPGCALYGINPTPDAPNPMQGVAQLSAPVVQVRTLEKEASVGYEATVNAPAGTRLAVIAIGYADGFLRALSNKGTASIGGFPAPVLGVISMDLTILDASRVPPEHLREGARAELIGPHQTVDAVADAAGTIGYEIFTRLGRRIRRSYVS